MKSLRNFVAATAASALLSVSQAEGAVAGDSERYALNASTPVAAAAANQVVFDVLVAQAEGGDLEAMNYLGVLYVMGGQVSRDYSEALFWFQKAIDGGSSNAMNNLARMYVLGAGVPRDYANAFRWFARSAAGGNVHSMYSVTVLADEGLGTAPNLRLARTMYRRAAEHGYGAAMIKLSDDYARGVGGSRDLVEAYAWLQLALQVGAPAELQLEVLAKIEQLGARLVVDRRDEARARAGHLAELVRARMRSSEPRGVMSGIRVPVASTQWVMAPLAATTSERRGHAE